VGLRRLYNEERALLVLFLNTNIFCSQQVYIHSFPESFINQRNGLS